MSKYPPDKMTLYWVIEMLKYPPDIKQSSDKMYDFGRELYASDIGCTCGRDCVKVDSLSNPVYNKEQILLSSKTTMQVFLFHTDLITVKKK